MVSGLIKYYNQILENTGWFDKVYELAQYSHAPKKRVGIYLSNGDFEAIPYDKVDGLSYWRNTQNPTITTEQGETSRGCETLFRLSFPLRLVCFAQKEKFGDTKYTEHELALSIISLLGGVDDVIKKSIKAKRVSFNASSYITDNARIIADEWDGEIKDVPSGFIYIAIDATIEVLISQGCIDLICDTAAVSFLSTYNFCNPSVQTQLTDAQIACLEAWLCGDCVDGEVQVNGGDFTTVASGGTVDIEVVQNNVPVGSKVGNQWVIETCPPCADGDVSLNGTPVTTVASGGTVDIEVVQGGNPVGSLVNGQWIINECPDAPSISISLSDATPSFGDVVRITITAVGFVPTNYKFAIQQGEGSDDYHCALQGAPNFFDYTVVDFGNLNVICVADDGTLSATDTEVLAVDTDPHALLFIQAHQAATNAHMRPVQQSAIDTFVRMLKGVGTTNGTDIWTGLLANGGMIIPYCPIADNLVNSAAYAIDLANPARTITFNNFLFGDFNVTGLTGAAGKFANTHLQTNDFPNNDLGLDAYVAVNTASNYNFIGSSATLNDANGTGCGIQASSNTAIQGKINATGYPSKVVPAITGLLSVHRISATQIELWRNGAIVDIPINQNFTTTTAFDIYLHAINAGGNAVRSALTELRGFAIRQTLSTLQMQDWNEAWQAYQTNVITGGRNV